MNKNVNIPNFPAIAARLLRGESFEGRLYIDKDTQVLTLKLWNRRAPKHPKYRKTGETDYGGLWESDRHLMWQEKYPLSMGLDRMLTAMEADKNQAQKNLVDEYIFDGV